MILFSRYSIYTLESMCIRKGGFFMNRKKAVERNCRLWMILAMLFTLLMAVAVPKHFVQAENFQGVICNDINKPVTEVFVTPLQGQTCTAVFTNATSYRMKMDIEVTVHRTRVIEADHKLKQFLWNDGMTSRTMNGYIIMEPNETANLKFQFRTDYNGNTSITVKPSLATVAENGGSSFQAAQSVGVSAEETGIICSGNNIFQNGRYFTFYTPNRRLQNLMLTAENGKKVMAYLYSGNDSGMKNALLKVESGGQESYGSVWLEPGTYVLAIGAKGNGQYASYRYRMTGRDYIQATGVSLTCTESDLTIDEGTRYTPRTFTFVASTIPANSDDKLNQIESSGKISCQTEGSVYGENTKSFTVTFDASGYRGYQAGSATIKVTSTNGLTSAGLSVFAKAGTPSVPYYKVYPTQVVFSVLANGSHGSSDVAVYQKSGSSWKRLGKNQKGETVANKLKANTNYQFKFVESAQKADGTWVEGTPLYKTIRTQRKEKPAIRSVKVSKVKVRYKWKYLTYVGWRKWWYTDFRVTVTLKKKLPAGQKLYINGRQASGKGKKYSMYFSLNGKKKGKSYTLSIQPYGRKGDAEMFGTSMKKKIRIR